MQSRINTPANFSERLSLVISRDGRTKAQIAEAAGVKPPALSRWLNGSVPDYENARDLANALNVPVNWLINGDEHSGTVEEAAAYKVSARTRHAASGNPSSSSAPDLLHACSLLLGGLVHANSQEAYTYGVQGFEELWERYKSAKQAELS
ncbi:MAG: helix-turn-helix transcriptional regulator [Verrucomicrobiota bacterium]